MPLQMPGIDIYMHTHTHTHTHTYIQVKGDAHTYIQVTADKKVAVPLQMPDINIFPAEIEEKFRVGTYFGIPVYGALLNQEMQIYEYPGDSELHLVWDIDQSKLVCMCSCVCVCERGYVCVCVSIREIRSFVWCAISISRSWCVCVFMCLCVRERVCMCMCEYLGD